MTRILFLSNGHGEDTIGATIISALKKRGPNLQISALPIVGEGSAYESVGAEILGPRRPLPSGGFLYQSIWLTLKDLAAGLVGTTVAQIRELVGLRGKIDLTMAIGDVVPIYGALFTKAPFVFYGCAKSDYFDHSYNGWELWLLRKFSRRAFARDTKTAARFSRLGIPSSFVGNPMMDALTFTGETFGISSGAKVIGILPGTREDVWQNLQDIVDMIPEIIKAAPSPDVYFLVALAPHLPEFPLKNIPPRVQLIRGKFGDILQRSDAIIGLSGTGNEQAVGLGKPVITFGGRGVQHTLKFAQAKKQLLGDAVSLVSADGSAVAREIWAILSSPERLQKMRAAGTERMGGPGATAALVESILSESERKQRNG